MDVIEGQALQLHIGRLGEGVRCSDGCAGGGRNEEEVFSSLPVNDMQEKTSSPPEALPGQASPGRLAGSRTGLQRSRLLHAEPGGLGCQNYSPRE